MKRRFFNAGAVVSLVLCLGVSALWITSYWRHHYMDLDIRGWEVTGDSNFGSLTLLASRQNLYTGADTPARVYAGPSYDPHHDKLIAFNRTRRALMTSEGQRRASRVG